MCVIYYMPKKLDLSNSENPYFIILTRASDLQKNRQRGIINIPRWNCICKTCGGTAIVQQQFLSTQRNRSCGCLLRKRGNQHKDWKGVGEFYLDQFTEIQRAGKIRRIPFEVDMSFLWELFLSQNRICALTGEPLTLNAENRKRGNASLDRIDNSKGYVKGNVRWVLRDANLMKRTLSDAELLRYAKLIIKYSLPKGESLIICNQ